jgi:phosphoglycolate phosphatase-like HAD superfamily hydrolase
MPLEIGRVRAVCFDVDGTLSDTDNLWVARLERALRPLRGFFPRKDVHSFARRLVMELETPGNLIYELLDWLHLDDEAARLLSALSRRRKDGRGHFLLVPGVDRLLADLQPRYPLAVVSARGETSTLAFLDQFGLTPFFTAIATAQTCARTKPFPDPILWAAERLGVSPENCLMVGDTTVDIRAGRAAGAQTVGVLCGFGTQAELLRAGADLILESTADLAAALAELKPA